MIPFSHSLFIEKRKRNDDDDDFIVPDDIDEDIEFDVEELRSSSSRPSSRLSAYSRSSAASDTEPDFPSASRSKTKSERPQLKKEGSSTSGGSHIFLTAAEQRTQRQKADKKSSEDPFSFLLDPRDKDGVRSGEPGYDPRTLYIPPRAWKEFTPFEKQVCVDHDNIYSIYLAVRC